MNSLSSLFSFYLVTTYITKGEEIRMGICLVKTEEWWDDNQVLDKHKIEIIGEEDVEHEEGEMTEDEIDDQTIQNIEETMGRLQKRGMSMALYRGKDHPKRGNIRHFSITCSR